MSKIYHQPDFPVQDNDAQYAYDMLTEIFGKDEIVSLSARQLTDSTVRVCAVVKPDAPNMVEWYRPEAVVNLVTAEPTTDGDGERAYLATFILEDPDQMGWESEAERKARREREEAEMAFTLSWVAGMLIVALLKQIFSIMTEDDDESDEYPKISKEQIDNIKESHQSHK